jgi:hypothetical protein
MYAGNASYYALSASLVKRASRGLTFKTNYTYSKILDMNSATCATFGANEPQDILNPWDLKKDKGEGAASLRHQFNANFSYELPFGSGQRWGGASGKVVDQLIGGWQWNGIFTAQSGFSLHASNRRQHFREWRYHEFRRAKLESRLQGTGDSGQGGSVIRSPGFLAAACWHLWECIARDVDWAGPHHVRHVAVQKVPHQ